MPRPDVIAIYQGSSGDATRLLYAKLQELGAPGVIALNLFRACKSSERAKVYRRGSHRGASYDKKQWSMENLCAMLKEHGVALGIGWGWGVDKAQAKHCFVLYVDSPKGQVSFHSESRGPGPNYAGAWDEAAKGTSATRICAWVSDLLDAPQ